MKQGRLITIDIIKGIAIILVVIGHYIPEQAPMWYVEMRKVIYTFHMPLFMFASGYVYMAYRRDIPVLLFYKKKIDRLIIPYIVSSVVIIAIKMLMERFLPVENPVGLSSFVRLLYLPEAGYFLWYIWSLFTIFLIVPYINNTKKMLGVFALSLIAPFLPIDWPKEFCVGQTISMLQYFILGMILVEQKKFVLKLRNIPILLIVLSYGAIYYVHGCGLTVCAYVSKVCLPYIGIYMMCLLSIKINGRETSLKRILIYVSSCSFIIYLFHTTFEGFAKALVSKIPVLSVGEDAIFILRAAIVVLCGVLFPIILQKKVIERFRVTRRLFGLK